MGLLPILVPGVYSKFPQGVQLYSSAMELAAGTLTAVLFNIIFHHLNIGAGKKKKTPERAARRPAARWYRPKPS